jgi:hypothetical protein
MRIIKLLILLLAPMCAQGAITLSGVTITGFSTAGITGLACFMLPIPEDYAGSVAGDYIVDVLMEPTAAGDSVSIQCVTNAVDANGAPTKTVLAASTYDIRAITNGDEQWCNIVTSATGVATTGLGASFTYGHTVGADQYLLFKLIQENAATTNDKNIYCIRVLYKAYAGWSNL